MRMHDHSSLGNHTRLNQSRLLQNQQKVLACIDILKKRNILSDWEAQADTSPAAVQPEVAEPVAVQESAPVAPVSATEAPKKEV